MKNRIEYFGCWEHKTEMSSFKDYIDYMKDTIYLTYTTFTTLSLYILS